MRNRTKFCNYCKEEYKTLYRCKYENSKFWEFLCESCIKKIKKLYYKSYKYGGTWKSKKA
ncbi:MAG: hypothetical protein CMM91_06625 [Rickettsiales bacterium]|nr:hypothetical protein [Rickettsiales bacterium]